MRSIIDSYLDENFYAKTRTKKKHGMVNGIFCAMLMVLVVETAYGCLALTVKSRSADTCSFS